MSTSNLSNVTPARKSILVLSISKHLSGVPIATGIQKDWAKEKASKIADSFENVGFDVDPKDSSSTLKALKHELEARSWNGIIIGWCIRGHVEFTVLFEEVVALCFEVFKSSPETKVMFSTGPDNLMETVSRNFPVGETL